MRFARIAPLLTGLLLWHSAARTPTAMAQHEAAPDGLSITATRVATWTAGSAQVLQLDGPVTIATPNANLSAQNAVVWLSPAKNGLADHRYLEVALLGDALVDQPGLARRSAHRLYVDAVVRGRVQLQAETRESADLSGSELYRSASALRPAQVYSPEERRQAAQWLLKQPYLRPPTSMPATGPATQQARPLEPITIMGGSLQTTNRTADGLLAAVMTGKVWLVQEKKGGALIEMQADRAVLFTPLRDIREIDKARAGTVIDVVTGVYLEGDVQITQTPAQARKAETRLQANRVYYDTTTDRAVLTEVVLHTYDFKRDLPVVVRAAKARQMSLGEIEAEQARLTNSLFATPSYSIGASRLYIRQTESPDETVGTRTDFTARDLTLRVGGLPVFWFPYAAGTWSEHEPLRRVSAAQSGRFGVGIETQWGVYETLGKLPPEELDLSYNLNYYSERGPAVGMDARYRGGLVLDIARQPWTFAGDTTAFLVNDTGQDDLGRERATITPSTEWRGEIWARHQHFVPDDWQLQLTISHLSDPTYLEYWRNEQFASEPTRYTSFFVKRQRQNETLSLRLAWQFSDFPTTAELAQEQLAGVERTPELAYHRIGDSVLSDSGTLHSQLSLSRLRFKDSDFTLQQQGYRLVGGLRQSPGLRSIGTTGRPADGTYRADVREEINFPFAIGACRALPFFVARGTGYTESPEQSSLARWMAGGGFKLSSGFWKTDDSVESTLLDLHRLRHVVEPEINFFMGGISHDASEVYVYDEGVDAINGIGVLQGALHQRWQTQRGGAGRWRSVDAFTLNVEANWFFRRPGRQRRNPVDFRGALFPSLPEASIPRSGVSADAAWLISDTTSLSAEAAYNADEQTLAAASASLTVSPDPRVRYAISFRYLGISVDQIESGNRFVFEDQKLAQFSVRYQITSRYTLDISESYDFAGRGNIRSVLSLTRRFDRFFVALSLRVDRIGQDSAIGFLIYPEGFETGVTSSAVGNLLGGQ